MKARYINKSIKQSSQTINGRIIVLTGARQTGKTTIARSCMKDYVYLSIEDPVLTANILKLTASQIRALYPKAILDEIQKAPSLIESIKSVYDQWEETRYILLGSSQLLLLSKVKESLAGRCIIKEIYPLTLPEIRTQKWEEEVGLSLYQQMITQKQLPSFYPSTVFDPLQGEKTKAWNHYLQWGGYPALTAEERTERDKQEWLNNYVRTYLERDVRDLAAMQDLEPYKKLQYTLALQTGNLCNISNLATHIGMSSTTVKRYLQYLALSYQTITLQPWDRNVAKRLVKTPKIHYLDYGVLQAVTRKYGAPNGAEFESLIVSEIFKQTKQVTDDAQFYHFRTQDGREVDLLVEMPEGYYAFEIKMADKVVPADARHLRDLGKILDKPLIHSFVISNDTDTVEIQDGVTAVNAWMFLG